MKQYRLIKFKVDGRHCLTECPNDMKAKFSITAAFVASAWCENVCPHYRGTSGKRVKCSFGIDDKMRVM